MTSKLPIDRTTVPPYLLATISTHGHVVTSPGGERMMCGGVDTCRVCANDLRAVETWQQNTTALPSAVRRSAAGDRPDTGAPREPRRDRIPLEMQQSGPGNPAFLRRLDRFAAVPEVASFCGVLRDLFAQWHATSDDAIRIPGLIAASQVGDAVAAFVEALESDPVARMFRDLFADVPASRFTRAAADVLRERVAQVEKWGNQNECPITFAAIVGEETGELAEAALQTKFGGSKGGLHNVRKEAIHVAATALQAVECLDRGEWTWPVDGAEMCATMRERDALREALAGMVGVGMRSPEEMQILADYLAKQPEPDGEQARGQAFALRHAVAVLIETAIPIKPTPPAHPTPATL